MSFRMSQWTALNVCAAGSVFLLCVLNANAQLSAQGGASGSIVPMDAEELKSQLREDLGESDPALVQVAARRIMAATSSRATLDLYDSATIETIKNLEVVMRKYAGQATNFVPRAGDPDVRRVRNDLQRLKDAGTIPREDGLFATPAESRIVMLDDAIELLEQLEITEDVHDRVEIAEAVLIRVGRDRTVTQRLWRKSEAPTIIDVTRERTQQVEVPSEGFDSVGREAQQ